MNDISNFASFCCNTNQFKNVFIYILPTWVSNIKRLFNWKSLSISDDEKKKWQHIIKETTDNVQKVKKKKNVVVMSLICVCSAQRKSDFPFLKDNIFLPYGNACKKGTNRTYSEVCLEETGINEHCIFGISV